MSQPPIHQLVLNGSIEDVGSATSTIVVDDSQNRITYTNVDGKDCIAINSDGYIPKINMPFLATNTSSFTVGFWLKMTDVAAWTSPVAINGNDINFTFAFDTNRSIFSVGNGQGGYINHQYDPSSIDFLGWNHITLTYTNGMLSYYVNAGYRSNLAYGGAFTTSQITIGGNALYQSGLGGQIYWNGYLHQLCVFDYVLSDSEISTLYSQTQGNDILGIPPNPLRPKNLVVSVTTTSFTVTWVNEGATSYTYTINGDSATPSSETSSSATFISLTSNTPYALIITAINETESQASQPKNITTMPDPPGSINLSTSLVKSSSFVASWTGGERATSYTYTLNGTAATPFINNALTDKTVKFTDLTPTTAYTLVVKAINISGEAVSTPVTITTLEPAPLEPIHQIIFSDSADDLGTSVIEVGTGEIIEYTNYYGKDSVYINSDGTNPRIYTPCVFTETSSFTFGFWINFENVGGWCVPITMNGPNINITLGFNVDSMFLSIQNGQGGLYTQNNFLASSEFRAWNHITITYAAGIFTVYKNGISGGSLYAAFSFTTTQITIGGNTQYQLHLGGQVNWAGYLHQLCVFDSVLSPQYISQLVTQTQGNKVFIIPTNLFTPYELELSNLTYTGFKISWLGGIGASYTFSLNGDSVTPLVEGNSATFTGLSTDTSYILIITAANDTDSQTSTKTIRTMKPLSNPVHQFVFNGLTEDVGTTSSAMIVEDPASIIEYVTYAGKNCVHINSDTLRPNLKIPYVVSNTSSFTLSYWATITNNYTWQIPLLLIDGNKSLLFSALYTDSVYFGAGTSTAATPSSPDQSGWNHIVMTYSNGMCKIYVNGYIKFRLPYTDSFTSTELSICGNSKYLTNIFGVTICNVYLRQLCIFDSELNYSQVSDLYVKTQGNLAFSTRANTEVPYFITVRDVGYTSFKASWLGGPTDGYTYKLNGITVTPSTQLSKSVEFTGLGNGTDYSFVITVGEFSSSPVIIKTKATLPKPVNQFILNNSLEDIGTNPVTAVGQGIYTNYSGKDCLDISTDGTNSLMTIPYVITNTAPFTLSFWLHIPYTWYNWNVPVGVDDGNMSILEFAGIWDSALYIPFGNQNGHTDTHIARTDWTHVVLSYDNGYYNVYLNNNVAWSSTISFSFTSTRINIGGNNPFVGWYFGPYLTSAVAKIRQLCTFDVALNDEQVNDLYIQSQEDLSVGAPPNPLTPYNLSVSTITTTSFTVSWLGATGATSYTYTLNGSPATPTQTGNSATFTNLILDTAYTIVVTAVNDTESQISRPKSLRTLPNPPVKPVVSLGSQTSSSFTASWTGGVGATSYTYTLNGTVATPSTDDSLTSKQVIFTGLSLATTYTLVITAINSGGNTVADPVSTQTLEASPLLFLSASDYVSGAWTDKTGIPATLESGVAAVNLDGNGIILDGSTKWTFPNLSLDNAWTIEAWYKDNGTTQGQASIVSKKDIGNTNVGPVLGFMQNGSIAGAFYVLNDNWYQGTYAPLQTTMTHYAVTWDGTNMITYVNNEQVGSVVLSGTSFDNGQPFYIGSDWNGTSYINGELGELRIYNVALRTDQISSDYQESAALFGVLPSNPLTPYNLTLSTITNSSFKVSWSGATGATSYTYTLNGSPATPIETSSSATFTGLTAYTTYSIVVTAVNDTESQASRPKGVRTLPNAPLKPIVSVTSQTYNSFAVVWTYGDGATSYSYTLNGSPATPSTDDSLTSQTVVFTGLNASTAYTLVITAINSGGQTIADPVTATTLELPPFPVAIHQLILDNSTNNVGSSGATTSSIGDIVFTNYEGKDCINCTYSGPNNPSIVLPCAFTNESSFTISFWEFAYSSQDWRTPITLNDGTQSHIIFGALDSTNYIVVGIPGYYDSNNTTAHMIANAWNNITFTYENSLFKLYVNGINTGLELTLNNTTWESSQITIGFNHDYRSWFFGGQETDIRYIRQLCVFNSVLTPEDISTVYTLTEGNTVLGVPLNPLRPSSLTVSSITTTAFNVSWQGATGATSYTFTLNGSPATPSVEGKSATFTGLTADTDYSIVVTAVNDTESQASSPKNTRTLMNPPTALSVTIGSVTFNSFVGTWTGAQGASSYVYTLNEIDTTPFTQTANSVTFKNLIPMTAYTLIVTAVNDAGQISSQLVSTTTLETPPIPFPINQLLLDNSSDDVGSEPAEVGTTGDIIFTNLGDKDCVAVSVSNQTQVITVPCIVTSDSSFTISFWYFDNPSPWSVPITLNNGTYTRIIFGMGNASVYMVVGGQDTSNPSFGAGPSYNGVPSNIMLNSWNNFTLTLENNIYKLYVNGIYTVSSEYTFYPTWSSSQITIGYNINYSSWWFSQTNDIMYIRQVCFFDSALIAEQVYTLYTETQDNTVIAPPASPLTTYRIVVSIATTSFNVSWLGGVGALSYSFTLNGTPATPSTQTSNSAIFTGLTSGTSYTLVITAIGASDSRASNPKIIKTFSIPTNQLILNDSSEDLGTGTLAAESGDVIEYTNYAGKDCVFIVSDGTTPTIKVPCVFTKTSSFTFAFWINFDNVAAWCVPITMNGTNINITLAFNTDSMHLVLGDGNTITYNSNNFMGGSDFRTWNHITVTYANETVRIYKNGILVGSVPLTEEFTTSQITIGGNTKYQYGIGGQINWSGYLRQLCVFNSILSQQEISQLYTQTASNTVIVTITNPLKPYSIDLVSVAFTEFTISWSGAIGATSYTFTLNGASVIPTQTSNSATFTDLTPNTSYTVVVTAISATDTQSSFSKTVKTKSLISNPRHQFVFNGSKVDVGTNPSYTVVKDPASIEYVEYQGKDCVHINSDGNTPSIKIPYTVSNTSSFTVSYWVNFVNNGNWQIPVAIGDGKNSIIFIGLVNQELYVGSGFSATYGGGTRLSAGWNNIVTTYSNKNIRVYANGVIKFLTSFNTSFTSREINLCGNSKYGTSIFGPTIANAYIRQLCVFDYALNSDHVSQLYVATQGNSSFVQPTAPIYDITLNNIEHTSFDLSWLGDSVTYTLNGAPVTPIETANSASFTGLSAATHYSLVLTSGQYSTTISILTKKYLSAPINQFILNNSIQDVGIEPINSSTITAQGENYGTYDGKDSVSINTNGSTPAITIPYVITHINSFTVSFWINTPDQYYWNVPIGVDDTIRSIIGYVSANIDKYVAIGSKGYYVNAYRRISSGWVHVVIGYDNGIYTVYMNNKLVYNNIFEDFFTSTRINIGGNLLLAAWGVGGPTAVANIRQICTFDYSLDVDEVDELYTKTQGYTALALPPSPLFPYSISFTDVTFTDFTVTWLGGVGATLYTFTLNGIQTAPSSQTSSSATFTDLVPGTYYTVVVTAISETDSQASRPKRLLTKKPLHLPINQFVFVDNQDIGIQPVVPTVTDPDSVISYTNYAGKDSVYFITTDGILPKMNIPCVFTETSSFTIGFWINLDNVQAWSIPITMNSPNTDITWSFTPMELYIMVGNGQSTSYNSIYIYGFDFKTWNHITITYNNGTIVRYINGKYGGLMTFSQAFTTSQITIGGNDKYKYNTGTNTTTWSGYLHQLCVFDYTLDFDQVNELYTKTADNTVISIPTNPLTPYRLRISDLTRSSFTLTWLGGVGATSYTFIVNDSPFTPSIDIEAKSAIFTGLSVTTQYTIVLRAVSDTEQIYSYPIRATTISDTPTALSVTVGSVTYQSFVASWTGGEGASTYTYTLNGTSVTPSSQTPQSATFTSLSSTASYTLVVTAVNNSGQTSSEPVTVTTLSQAPTAPILSVSSITSQSFVASWTGAQGATSFTYTLNGDEVMPVEDGQTATFSDLSPDTNYTLIVRAVNSSGQTSSTPITIRTLKLPPTAVSLTSSALTYQSFVISVTGQGATSYSYTLNGSPFTPLVTDNSATFTDLSPATEYTVVVTAINNGGQTESSITLTTFSEPPTTPSVTVGSITFNSFVASWTSVGATSYDYTLNGTPVTPEESANSASFIGLLGATEYTLVVTAVNNGGRTSSAPLVLTTLPNPPSAPSVSTSSVTYQSFVASWTGGEGATSYSYTLNGSAVTPSTDNGLIGETATFTDLTGATEYTLVVTAINSGGQTSSPAVLINTLSNPPTAPSVTVDTITYNSAIVSWTSVGATSYSYTLNGAPLTPSSESSSSATFNELSGATSYTLVVTAINNGGQNSGSVEFTTLPNPPTEPNVSISDISYQSFVASWTGGEGADFYTYKLNGSTVTPSSESANSATFTSLSASTNYTLIVSAINAGGKTVSPIVVITTLVTPPTSIILRTKTVTYQSFVAYWTGAEGATSYTYTLNGSEVTPSTDNSLSNKTVIFTDLAAATNYTLVVTAINNGGQIDSSVSVKTLREPPTNITVSINTITYQSFVASWVGGQGATSYTYTLNGASVTPSSEDGSSATFASLSPQTSYAIVVTAVDEGGETSSDPVIAITYNTPPTAPIVSITSITYETFAVSWTGALRATSYTYKLNGSSVTPYSETSDSATFVSLSAATDYALIVTAVNNGGQTDSAPLAITTYRTPPTTPNVSTSSITYESFVASWTGGSGATSYSYMLNGSTVTPSVDNGVSGKSATFASLSDSTEYTLIVIAINNGGQTSSSDVTLTTLNTPAMALTVTISSLTYESFVASWTGGDGATSYAYTLNGSSVTPEDNGLEGKTATFTALSAATNYTLVVTAINNSGETSSPSVLIKTLSTPPTIDSVTASSVTYQSFVASWNSVGATSYTYTLNGSSVTPSSQGANSATFTSLSPERSYMLAVTAINNGGQATSSLLVITYKTPPTAPSVSTSSITDSSFVASWTSVGATSYTYTLNGSAATPSSESDTSATFTSLTASTNYTLIVTAVNNGGQASSTPIEITTVNTPPTISSITTNTITSQSFVASWTAARAASYTYALNGSPVTPSSQGATSATFSSLSPATSYTLVVTVINNGGQTTSDPTTVTTLNLAPSSPIVSITSITYQSFVASWTGASPVSSYSYTLNGSTVTPSVDNGLAGKTATFTDLSAATGYTLIVTAINNGGETSSTPLIVTTFNTPPTAPSVTADSITYNSFVATWTSLRATSYSYTLNGAPVTPSSQSSNSATFTSLSPTTSYTLVVTAINNGGQTSSSPLVLTTLNAPPLSLSLTASNITYQSFVATWTGASGATGYSYKLNGSTVTPSVDNGLTSKSATFSSLSGATSYTLIVTAITEGGQTASDPLTITTLPNPPTSLSLTASSITYQSFVGSWTGGSGATSYTYTLNGTTVLPSQSANSATFNGLVGTTSYTLVVTAINSGGQTVSSPLVITTLATPPTTPVLTASSVTYQSFVVSWSGSGATSYTYTLNGSSVTPSSQTANSATFASLNATTAYTVVVTAINNGGEAASAPLSVTTLTQAPTAPDVSVTSITDGSFVASWTGAQHATSYIYTLNGSPRAASVDNGLASKSATFSNLSGGTSYTLIVTAVNAGGQAASAASTITTLITPPTAPIVSASSITSSSFVASWTGAQRATSYSYMLNGSAATPSLDNGVTSKSVTFTNLSGDTAYTLIVTAINGGGQVPSTPLVVRTLIKPPTALSVTIGSITYNSAIVSWTGGSGATSYSFTINGSPATPSSQTANSATFSPLTPSSNYTLIVIATNGGGQAVSTSLIISTLAQVFPLPLHQLVLSESTNDTGSSYANATVTDPQGKISYTNNGGKDCVHIQSDGIVPKINFPRIFTETSSFTFSFWVKFDDITAWGVPVTMNGANVNVNFGFNATSLYISVGNGVNTSYVQNNIMTGSDFKNWNNISITYSSGSIKVYKNGVLGGSLSLTQAFTISQITLGGNYNYQSIGLGGQAIWDGYLRQICVFDSVLSADELGLLYTKTQDNTIIGSPLQMITALNDTLKNITTVQSATDAINAAIAGNVSPVFIVTAALTTVLPNVFTALVSNPAFVGSTVTIPSSVAALLYSSFEDTSTLDRSLPFKINFPAADNTVSAPLNTINSKLAIDLSVDRYVTFKGCTGYGIRVISGDQYFTTPSNTVGTRVRVGDVITFTTDGGETINSKVADLDIVLIPYTPPVICFLGSAPVLTPDGYVRIDSLKVGDLVSTREGDTISVVERVEIKEYMPGPNTNPYIIPAGRFGSNERILISPRHKVAVNGQMIEARFLGLKQEEQYEKIRYYNIQITDYENIIVAGLEVESLQGLTRINIPMETFNYIIANKYSGQISHEIKENCLLMPDGSMSVPMII